MIDVRTINLQLFAEEKTEKATPKRKKDAREKGQVVKSAELSTALSLLIMFLTLKILTTYLFGRISGLFTYYLTVDNTDEIFTVNGISKLSINIFTRIILIVGPIFFISFLVSLLVNYIQVGILFIPSLAGMKLERISPMQGFKRIFSKRSLVELLKSLIKLAIVIIVLYKDFNNIVMTLPNIFSQDLYASVKDINDTCINIGLKVSVALLGLAIVDYLYQWRDNEKKLMMSKEEIKEEYKQTEGNPQVRSAIKSKQRELSMRRMMQDIPTADVVITNPTHLAVVLKYDKDSDEAPIVVAKGKDYLAQKIKDMAKENNVIIVENKPLAQTLYKSTDIGSQIPEELFHAVAEVLAFVYSLNNKL